MKRIRVGEHAADVDLLLAIRTRLLLADDAPAADAELVEPALQSRRSQRHGAGDTRTAFTTCGSTDLVSGRNKFPCLKLVLAMGRTRVVDVQ